MTGFKHWFYQQPYLLLTLTSLGWAGNGVAGRLAVGEVSPMALTFLRWIMVSVILLAVAREPVAVAWPVLKQRWKIIAFMGALGFTGFNALFYAAAYHTTAVNLTIIQGAIPVLVLLGGYLVYRTPIRTLQAFGMVLTLVGVAIIATAGHLENLMQLVFNIGDVWMLVACVFYAFYTLALRNRPQVPGLALFAAMAVVALVTSIPLLVFEITKGDVHWPSAKGWLVLAYIAVFPSFLSQIWFMRGVELIGPARAGIFVNLVPVFGAILAVLCLGEPFGLYHGASLALVLMGILLAERK